MSVGFPKLDDVASSDLAKRSRSEPLTVVNELLHALVLSPSVFFGAGSQIATQSAGQLLLHGFAESWVELSSIAVGRH